MTALNPDARRDDERKKLPDYVRGALAELRQYGLPNADDYQGKVENNLDDIAIPGDRLRRLPSLIGASHSRHSAVHATAQGNSGMRFAYAKPATGKIDGPAKSWFSCSRSSQRQRHGLGLEQSLIKQWRRSTAHTLTAQDKAPRGSRQRGFAQAIDPAFRFWLRESKF